MKPLSTDTLQAITEDMRKIRFRALVHYLGMPNPVWEYYQTFHVPSWSDVYASCVEKVIVDDLQAIGQVDKNGVEIYEGDILRNGDWIGTVIYKSPEYKFNDGKSDFSISFREFEIIGNIYENPELLNSEQKVHGSVATEEPSGN